MWNTYGIVCRAQSTWSAKRIENCRINAIDKALQIKIPAVVCEGGHDGMDQIEPAADTLDDRSALDILISGTPSSPALGRGLRVPSLS